MMPAYVVIAVAFGDGDDYGGRIHAIRFNSKTAAAEATDWLNSLATIMDAHLFIDTNEETHS